MNHKKQILKKYTGKGGIITDTIKEIPGTIGKAYNNVKNKVQSGISKGIVKFVGDTPAGKIIKDGLQSQKSASLKNVLQKIPKGVPPTMIKATPSGRIPSFRMPKVVPPRNDMDYDVVKKLKPNPDSVNYKG